MNNRNSLPVSPPVPGTRNFLVLGQHKALVIQVLLAIRTFTDANCIAACARKTRLLSLTNLCSSSIKMEFEGEDDDMFVEYVNRLAQTMPDLVLVPADCEGTKLIGRLRHRMKVATCPYPDEATMDCFNNKWRFYQFCAKHGLSVPVTTYIPSKYHMDFGDVVGELGLPFVVKPISECATKGVEIIRSEEEYRRRILDNDAYQFAPLIVQRYIRGTDVGLNLLALEGKVKAIAIQRREHPQYDGAKITFIPNSYLERIAYTVAERSSYHGVMNIDARIEDGTGQVFLLESNPRFWRSLSASVWCGLNFVAECLEASSQSGAAPRMLVSGHADTYYHPLIRHSLLRDVVFGSGRCGRMARLMMCDMCTLAGQLKEMLKLRSIGGRPDPPAVSDRPREAG